MATTPALITAAQVGDQAALAELYRQHHRAVRGYLANRVGPELAEDLAQDVWVRAIRALPAYQWTGRDFSAWLTTIARNLIADHFKAATRREVLTDDLGRHDTAVPGPEDLVLAEVDAVPVRTAVAALPPVHRQALVLTHWAGWSNAEISASTGRSPAAVRTLKCRASNALRLALTAA